MRGGATSTPATLETIADAVAMLRVEAGRAPYDKALTDLIGELGTRSDEFKQHRPPAAIRTSTPRPAPSR